MSKATKQQIARHGQHIGAVGEDERTVDISGRLFGHACERGQEDLLRLLAEDLERGRAGHLFLSEDPGEDWGFENAQTDIKADADHDDADQEWNSPAPHQKLIPRHGAEAEQCQIGEREPGWGAELRPRRDEATMFIGARPFHGQQHRPAPFAAEADTLDEPQQHQDNRAPDADRLIGWHQADGERGEAGQQQGHDQRVFASNPVAVVPEQRRPDGSCDEPEEENHIGLQGADQRVGPRKVEFREHDTGDCTVQQEVIGLDCRSDCAGDHRTPELPAVFGVGQDPRGMCGC